MSIDVSAMQFVNLSNYSSSQAMQGAGGTAASATAHASDVSSFRQTFADAKPVEASQTVTTPQVEGTSPGIKSILGQFDSLNGNASKLTQLADEVRASGDDLKPSQIIDMTLQAHELVFQAELTSNVANRSSEGVQQLFRQQS